MTKTKSTTIKGIPAEVHDAMKRSLNTINSKRKPMTPEKKIPEYIIEILAQHFKIKLK